MVTSRFLYNNLMSNVLPGRYNTIAAYANGMFAEKVPAVLRRHFEAEQRYMQGRAKELDEILTDLVAEKYDHFKSDPIAMLKKPIHDLLKFDDPARHREFSAFVYQTIEDFAYAAEQAAYKVDQIVQVKLETPIIRGVARKALEREFWQSDLPLTDILTKIECGKNKGLMAATDVLGTPYHPSSTNELKTRYEVNIPQHSMPSSTFISRFPTHTSEAILQREWHYTMHPYNSFFEKIIGSIGAVGNYICNSLVELFTEKVPKKQYN